MSDLQKLSKAIRGRFGREYIRWSVRKERQEMRRETDAEIRQALERHGWIVAESAS